MKEVLVKGLFQRWCPCHCYSVTFNGPSITYTLTSIVGGEEGVFYQINLYNLRYDDFFVEF